ncbi:MAG: HU family DNA-binding protein [Phocaeicola sp.]
MPIKYDFYSIPDPKDKEKMLSHVRVTETTIQSPKEIERDIRESSSLTDADIRSALKALSDVLYDNLLAGKRIHLEGIGFFSLTIQAKRNKKGNIEKARAPQMKVKSIVFRPEKELLKRVQKHAKFSTPKHKKHSPPLSEKKLLDKLELYFSQHEEINREGFQMLTGYTRSTALRRLKGLVEKQVLVDVGSRHEGRYRYL